jgi:predicted nuclease with TOPRIM domain
MKSIEEIHRAIFGDNEDDEKATDLQDEVNRLQKQLDETQALLDKEMKDHFHTHQLALRLKEQLKEATKCINWVIDTFQKGLEHEPDVVGCCQLSIERIEELK